MEMNALAQAIDPIHRILQKVSASPIESLGIQPERLTCYYSVSKQREPKFLEIIRRLLAVDQVFEDRCPLCVWVTREVELSEDDEVVLGGWQIQFQVNEFDRSEDEVTQVVYKQIEALLFDLESFLYD